jgi:hypothetical protein
LREENTRVGRVGRKEKRGLTFAGWDGECTESLRWTSWGVGGAAEGAMGDVDGLASGEITPHRPT